MLNLARFSRRGLLAIAVLCLTSSLASAAVKLPSVISDGMVLQQKQPITVWGQAEPNEKVVVDILTRRGQTQADADGKWKVSLDPLPAGGPYELHIASSGQTTVVKDVLIGEVWICSGQSNMQWSFKHGVDDAEKHVAEATYPQIRLFDVPRRSLPQPQEDVDAKWTHCTPETVKDFSAVGYFFGRKLHKKLGVPVGLIGSNFGGTPSEAWTSRQSLEAEPSLEPLLERWDKQVENYNEQAVQAWYEKKLAQWQQAAEAAKAEGKPAPGNKPRHPRNPAFSQHRPAGLYNAMIAPLIDYNIAGTIWYQGESNARRAYQYRTVFPTQIKNWREAFDQPNMPFYFVQIAPYRYNAGTACPELWEAQLYTHRTLPYTGMVVISDVGNIADIHPRNKLDVGRRLAKWALAKTYGFDDIVYSGPLYSSAEFKDDKAVVHFEHTGSGLTTRNGEAVTHFEIAGEDQKYHPATATIKDDTVVVHSDAVANPVAVRFAWDEIAEPNLMNKEGLPASPFRTDQWGWATKDSH